MFALDNNAAPSTLMAERMDEFGTEESAESPAVSAASPRWAGAQFIALAQQLNAQCVELLCQLAGSADGLLPPFVLQNRDRWRILDIDARKRVAAFPFVILDIRFTDIEWWRELVSKTFVGPNESTAFSDLFIETLLFARQAVREDVNIAKAMFAMTSPVASVIASLSLQQVRSIASSSPHELRVRWENDPKFWCDLLVACQSADQPAMDALRRHAKLHFLAKQ